MIFTYFHLAVLKLIFRQWVILISNAVVCPRRKWLPNSSKGQGNSTSFTHLNTGQSLYKCQRDESLTQPMIFDLVKYRVPWTKVAVVIFKGNKRVNKGCDRASLLIQWLRIRLAMQGKWVQFLVKGTKIPLSMEQACALQLESLCAPTEDPMFRT